VRPSQKNPGIKEGTVVSRASVAAPHPAQRRSLSPRGGTLVLVVDDEPQVRDSITRVLTRHGLRVVAADDGVSALAAVESADFRAIVADVRMDGLDGLQLFDRLQSEHPALARRVVFVTAWAHDPVTRAALERTGRPVLLKPFDIQALVTLVRHVAEDRPGNADLGGRFSAEEVRLIRRQVQASRTVSCPCCVGALSLRTHPDGLVEVRCVRCNRGLALGEIPPAG
jgi:CheY-like chemotaxis protein